MPDQIIFYDLPSRHKGDNHPSCFSFNPWKIRTALNYKKIPYTTEFVEYPDVAPKFKALGVPPNEPGTAFADYSIPTVQLPDGTIIMNSTKIIKKLESLHPEPSLHLDEEREKAIGAAVEAFAGTTWWDAMVKLVQNCLTENAAEWFAENRKQIFGASLEDLAASMGGQKGFDAAFASGGTAEKLKEQLTKYRKDEGPFVLGSQVSYGDFLPAALFENFERVDPEAYEKIMGYDPVFKNLHEACRPWLERDN